SLSLSTVCDIHIRPVLLSHASPPVAFHFFFFYCSGPHRDLHSFPTRRSSDLDRGGHRDAALHEPGAGRGGPRDRRALGHLQPGRDRKSTRLNSSHRTISYAVFCLKKKKKKKKKQKKKKTKYRKKITDK